MRVLCFDTETTGLPIWKEPSDHPDQPHVVDLAISLFDDGVEVERFDAILACPVPIPPELSELHGITNEICDLEGIPKSVAIERFMGMVSGSDLIIGHNVSFDLRMMRIEAARATGMKWDNPLPIFCTMRKSTNICRILSEKPRHEQDWKWPRLSEAVRALFGEELPDAHRARPDCDAAARIYFHLRQIGA